MRGAAADLGRLSRAVRYAEHPERRREPIQQPGQLGKPYQSQDAQVDTAQAQPEEKSSQGEEAQMVTLYIGMDDQFSSTRSPTRVR